MANLRSYTTALGKLGRAGQRLYSSLMDWASGGTVVPASLVSLTGSMDSAYRGQPAVYAYNGTRTDLYTMDTAYRGQPGVVAVSA